MLFAIRQLYNDHPLKLVLLLGFAIRLISVIFSTGYGMHDDHFLVVEAAQSWVEGYDYNNWLPANSVSGEPTGHSFFYVGLHYLFFRICEFAGLTDPQFKMLIIRLIHACWSMITVLFGFKITQRISNTADARIVGLLLAVFWFYPILSVRNMVEMVCVPFIMLSLWYLLKEKTKWQAYVLAGIFMGLAIAVRLQVYLILGGVGLYLLINRKIWFAILFGMASIISLFITQITDLFLWAYPFAEIGQYIFYNSTHYNDYITQSWFQYFLLLGGIMIPPVSLFLLFGYFRSWRKYMLIFLPSILFIIFHSIYPNKQERFILPVLPLIIIPGVVGWRSWLESSAFWKSRPKFYKGILTFFWSLNMLALIIISPANSKKSRVDSMYYLRSIDDVKGILVERTTNYGCYLLPRFYSGKWDIQHYCYSKDEIERNKVDDIFKLVNEKNLNYCLFIEEEDIERRINEMEKYFPNMEFVAVIEPSYMDKLFHFLNPRNQNEVIYIYRFM